MRIRARTVSYTHLDVYKRQQQPFLGKKKPKGVPEQTPSGYRCRGDRFFERGLFWGLQSRGDVYKRQGLDTPVREDLEIAVSRNKPLQFDLVGFNGEMCIRDRAMNEPLR